MMHSSFARLVLVAAAASANSPAHAQSRTTVLLSAGALASYQPVDETYVGSPYLSEGLGGLGPGFLLGASVTPAKRLVLGVEYTRAHLAVDHNGRVVIGEGKRAHSVTTDGVLSIMVGTPLFQTNTTRIDVFGGPGFLLDTPTTNGSPREGPDKRRSVVLSAGVDVARQLRGHLGVFGFGRLHLIDRDDAQTTLGLGEEIFRFGGGLRVSL